MESFRLYELDSDFQEEKEEIEKELESYVVYAEDTDTVYYYRKEQDSSFSKAFSASFS